MTPEPREGRPVDGSAAIDLHTHTNCSDGTDSPTELIGNAIAAGCSAIALTDHDTTAGWAAAAEAVVQLDRPFTLIRGTEFSCVHTSADGTRTTLHLLGYLFDPDHQALKRERARLRDSRAGRAEQMVSLLAAAGHRISWQHVTDLAGDAAVGRPHIAQALVEVGAVGSLDEAFTGLIAKGSPFHVSKQDLDVTEAVQLIAQAGGVSVVAHVLARLRGPVLTLNDIDELIEGGLAGIEVDHPDHSEPDRQTLREVVRRHDLIATGSSDYHGERKFQRLGAETTAPEMLARMVAAGTGSEPIRSPGR